MERKNEEKISNDYAIEIAASSQNSLTGGSGRQTVARINLGPKNSCNFSQNSVWGSTCGKTEILGDECFGKN